MAQNYVEIGTGSIPNTMPIYSSWNYSWSSLIYNNIDLGAAKTFTKIGLNCINGPKTVTNQKIYVKLSSSPIFNNANYEDPLSNGYTLVYQGNLTFQNGWNEIVLSTPINYDGAQNILIHWENRWGATYGPQFTSTASSINNNKNCGNDSNFPPPSQSGYLNPYPSSLTNMRFYYTSSGPATPTNPIPADNAVEVSVDTDLSCTLGANTTSYDLYMGTSPQNLQMVVNNVPCSAGVITYTLPGLLADSVMHYWRVVAKNLTQTELSPVWKFKTEVVIDQFPFSEGFEDSLVFNTFPVLSAWKTFPEFSWYQYDANKHSGNFCAKSFSSIAGNSAILQSPKVLLPPGHSISYYWRNTSINKVANHDTTFFEITTNGGNNWIKIDTLAPATQNPAYIQRTHNLNAYSGNNFFFRFRHKTNNSSSACNVYLDDISVFQSGATPTLAVTPVNQNVTSPAGSTTFNVSSNSDWTATCNQSWCNVTPSGNGNAILNATYSQNTTGNQRVANITVSVNGINPVVVTVTQGIDAPVLSVTPSNHDVSSAAGSVNYSVTSSSAWNVTSDKPWCTVTPSGNGNGVVVATFQANTELSPRVANITITVTGLTPVIVTLTQAGGTAFLTATPGNQDVSYQAGTTNFTINSNSNWVSSSDAPWCVVTSTGTGNGTLFANYSENTIASVRIAHIAISLTGVNPVVVTVTQQGPATVLTVNPTSQNVTFLPGVTSFAVTSNANWTAVSDAVWCQPTASGVGSSTLSASYTQNSTLVTRIATITVSAPNIAPVLLQVLQQPSLVEAKNLQKSEMVVYPNPTSDIANIVLPNIGSEALMILFDAEGNKMLEKKIATQFNQLDVKSLAKGIYFLEIRNRDFISRKKIVII